LPARSALGPPGKTQRKTAMARVKNTRYVSLRIKMDWKRMNATVLKANWTEPERDGMITHLNALKKAELIAVIECLYEMPMLYAKGR
jgi:hypothetical protein